MNQYLLYTCICIYFLKKTVWNFTQWMQIFLYGNSAFIYNVCNGERTINKFLNLCPIQWNMFDSIPGGKSIEHNLVFRHKFRLFPKYIGFHNHTWTTYLLGVSSINKNPFSYMQCNVDIFQSIHGKRNLQE